MKAAVLPLVGKDGQPELAREVHAALRGRVQSEYDEGGAIGKRYRRQDEIGTPLCITIDHISLEDRTVTLRDRNRSRRSGCRSTASPTRKIGEKSAVENPQARRSRIAMVIRR